MQVKRAELVESLQIVADADRLTSRAGTVLLSGLADRVGLIAERLHTAELYEGFTVESQETVDREMFQALMAEPSSQAAAA